MMMKLSGKKDVLLPLLSFLVGVSWALSPQVSGAATPAFNDHRALDQKICAEIVDQVSQESDLDRLDDCMELYWHNGQFENPPGSFSNLIKLGYRYLELDPYETDLYSTMAWLLWSKWRTWKDSPELMPDGENKVEEAISLLYRGRDYHWENANYFKSAGEIIWPLAKHYRPELFSFVIENFEIGETLANDPALKIKFRLNLGHAFRHQQRKDDAIFWFERVLELDPENKIALENLEKLREQA